jgi:hypothetical protein
MKPARRTAQPPLAKGYARRVRKVIALTERHGHDTRLARDLLRHFGKDT